MFWIAHAALCIHDQLILANELIHDFDGLIEQATGIVPEVEH